MSPNPNSLSPEFLNTLFFVRRGDGFWERHETEIKDPDEIARLDDLTPPGRATANPYQNGAKISGWISADLGGSHVQTYIDFRANPAHTGRAGPLVMGGVKSLYRDEKHIPSK